MYKKVPVKKLTGNEQFKSIDPKNFTVSEFWQYGFSNLNSNILRGALAEFIVESALKEKKDIDIRNPWGDYDVLYNGKKIEVKSCSYLQDWDQNKHSTILWSGLKAKSIYWSDAVEKFKTDEKADYKSDIYILSLLDHKEPETLDILNLNQWKFYILKKEDLKRIAKDRNTVTKITLEKNKIEPVMFGEIKKMIDAI